MSVSQEKMMEAFCVLARGFCIPAEFLTILEGEKNPQVIRIVCKAAIMGVSTKQLIQVFSECDSDIQADISDGQKARRDTGKLIEGVGELISSMVRGEDRITKEISSLEQKLDLQTKELALTQASVDRAKKQQERELKAKDHEIDNYKVDLEKYLSQLTDYQQYLKEAYDEHVPPDQIHDALTHWSISDIPAEDEQRKDRLWRRLIKRRETEEVSPFDRGKDKKQEVAERHRNDIYKNDLKRLSVFLHSNGFQSDAILYLLDCLKQGVSCEDIASFAHSEASMEELTKFGGEFIRLARKQIDPK